MSIRRNLPSLNALVVLEAAARHRSFTSAAAELGVTQAAVSRQIAMLEEDLGTPLFVRRHRAVDPTPPCQLLASSLAVNFAAITESVAMVRATKQQEAVTIGATLAFSTLWLLPRLRDFRERYPGALIRVMSQDSRIPLTAGEADVVVRFGTPPFEDGAVVASRADVMFPVCSPAYAERIQGNPMAALRNGECDLIGHDVPDRTWGTWPDWFRRVGWSAAPPEPALRFNHYSDALQSARAGQGVVLGWGIMVQGSLEEGALVRLGDETVPAEGRYNVIVPLKPKPSPLRDVLTDWLAEKLSG
jgi:DNA-binding transcriptional LysR family regulator